MTKPQPAKRPERTVLEGSYVRLEPIGPQHARDLLAATSREPLERFAYLSSDPPTDIAGFERWTIERGATADPILFAVIDRATGRAGGWQQLMRIDAPNGVIEIGNIYWGPDVARTRIVTEGLYLTARHIFEQLGYRRFEWKCNNRNEPSKRAAERFGFTYEGLFRQHMIVRGENRDTAWFAMLDGEWPTIRAEYERWLAPENFAPDGTQKSPLRIG